MLKRALLKIIAPAVIVSANLSVGLVSAPAASAATTCTLKGSLPSKVVLNKTDTIFYSTLSGSSSCKSAGGDIYASASFDGPQGQEDWPNWDRVGKKYRFDMYAWSGRAGSYTLRDGDAFVYNSAYDDIPVVWKSTSTKIKFGSRVASTASSRSGRKVKVSAKVQRYTTDASYKAYKSTVYLQRRTKSSSTYKSYKTLTSTSAGKVSYSYSNSAKYYYRFATKESSSVWASSGAGTYR